MRVCELTGKRRNVANNVSHSHVKTKKWQQPNLQNKRVFIPEKGRYVRMTLSTRAIRTINRIGLKAACGKYGVDYDRLVATHLI